jgi:hypothetical protein
VEKNESKQLTDVVIFLFHPLAKQRMADWLQSMLIWLTRRQEIAASRLSFANAAHTPYISLICYNNKRNTKGYHLDEVVKMTAIDKEAKVIFRFARVHSLIVTTHSRV